VTHEEFRQKFMGTHQGWDMGGGSQYTEKVSKALQQRTL